MRLVWWAVPERLPVFPNSWFSCSCVCPSYWKWNRNSDLFPTMRTWKKCWEITSRNRVGGGCEGRRLSSCCRLSLTLFVAQVDGTQLPCYKLPHQGSTYQGAEEILWLITCKHVNSTISPRSEIVSGLLLVEPWDDYSPGQHLDCIVMRGSLKYLSRVSVTKNMWKSIVF